MAGLIKFMVCILVAGIIGWFFPNICGIQYPSGKEMFAIFYYFFKALTTAIGLAAGGVVGVVIWRR